MSTLRTIRKSLNKAYLKLKPSAGAVESFRTGLLRLLEQSSQAESEEFHKNNLCQVLHTPVPGNFWHFSLRWITDEGDVIYQMGKWRKRLFSAARNMIVEKASLNIPNLTVIPEQFYKKF